MIIVIPISIKDSSTIERILPYLNYLNADKVYVISSKSVSGNFKHYNNIVFVDEDTLYPGLSFKEVQNYIRELSPKAIRRSGWYYQQFLKMAFSEISPETNYMVWDVDTIPLKKLSFFNDDGKPYFDFIENQKCDSTYFETLENLFPQQPLKRKIQVSFVTEHMIFNSYIMKELLQKISSNGIMKNNDFWKNILLSIKPNQIAVSGFSEFETYANFVLAYYPHFYELRRWRNLRSGRCYVGDNPTKQQLEWVAPYFYVVSIEDFCPKIYLSTLVFKLGINMYSYYQLLNPFLKIWFKLREFIRQIIKG